MKQFINHFGVAMVGIGVYIMVSSGYYIDGAVMLAIGLICYIMTERK